MSLVAKRSIDIAGALLLVIVFAPMIVIVCSTLWRTGGVIFKHRRIGRGGKTFDCLKFRTMVPNADRILQSILASDEELMTEWLLTHKLRNDPRITWIGRFLRRTSLDELPQLWNVLRGDMSLVGPRPVTREELPRYGRRLRKCLAVKPGITGLWQTMGRSNTSYRRRIAMDVYYATKQSLLLDIMILFRTIPVVFERSGAY